MAQQRGYGRSAYDNLLGSQPTVPGPKAAGSGQPSAAGTGVMASQERTGSINPPQSRQDDSRPQGGLGMYDHTCLHNLTAPNISGQPPGKGTGVSRVGGENRDTAGMEGDGDGR